MKDQLMLSNGSNELNNVNMNADQLNIFENEISIEKLEERLETQVVPIDTCSPGIGLFFN